MTELQTHAAEIAAQFSDHIDVETDEIEQRLDQVVSEYKIPIDEARRTVTNSLLDEADIDRDELGRGGAETVLVDEIDQDEQWVDVTVKVVDLWEPRSDSISQVGLVGDESGRIKFVAFETSELDELEEGASYKLGNVVTDEYQGDYSIKLNRTTTITELDEDVEVGDSTTTVDGALVDVQSGSGLIKRCPEEGCTRVLQNGRCSEHGEVDGEFDLRIKAVLDDGHEVQDVIFNREATEELTGIGLEDAKQQAQDALDTSVVADGIRTDILGRYYRVTGPTLGRYVLANEFEQLDSPTDTDAVLTKARSLQ
ncbi:replication factor A [Halohasta litorea]|uniref:Replication factor A n=1 Tax=Halohasta litorea TaxID=869891 RepID=A0ABD6D8D5_9EURY|nr:replication factor A [Halohasta litorea]